MAYNELIKNFNRIRDYMREFYVYGFKSRDKFTRKSSRSYDDERRRIESWLGDYMSFRQTADGKNVFMSIDSRVSHHNPLYKAFKTKSFTDGDITLHFILMDILSCTEEPLSISEITEKIDEYLCNFSSPRIFDESTVRKKLKEYVTEGIILKEKKGKTLYYSLSEDNVNLDFNKKDIMIFHTHTCESYTTTEQYSYEETGTFRSTDLNYSVARVGTELTNYLKEKGFNVTHNTTYHDYPAYSGSYARSLNTLEGLLEGKNTQLVFDLHRDAVGSSNEYAPTIKINDNYVAQIMFVIGTNGGGLEHPNWVQNLKIAVKIQEKANEMYPGLFRPIIIRNSRYNQHLTNGSSIIEVGATGNTMEQCILSMQCLSNVLAEICK